MGSIRSLRHSAQRPGGVRELSMAWHRGLVGGVNKVAMAWCTEAWWGEGAVHGMVQLPCSIVEDP